MHDGYRNVSFGTSFGFMMALVLGGGVSLVFGCSASGSKDRLDGESTDSVEGTNSDDSDTTVDDGDTSSDGSEHASDALEPDDSDSDDPYWENDTFDECAAVSETAQNTYQPLDIIFTIDNTPSMLDEINEVRANMNLFSEQIATSGLDAHIVLISCLPGDCDNDKFHGICIDGPLGAPDGCTAEPPEDTNLPGYFHVSRRVPSVKGLGLTLDTYDDWKFMLRDGAKTHFVIVSDDTDETDAAAFHEAVTVLDGGRLADYQFNGIFAYMSKEAACDLGEDEACCTYAAPEGNTDAWETVYADLVELTGGVSGDLCLQDFDPVFDALAHSVIASAELSCAWEIPPPPDGETMDPDRVNVDFLDGEGAPVLIGHVYSEATCDQVEHAWYYDDEDTPSEIRVCPETCQWIRGFANAQIVLQFGCETQTIAPI